MSKPVLPIVLICIFFLILPAVADPVISSPDGLVTLTSPDSLKAELDIAVPINPSEDWVPVGEAYVINPPDLVITTPATLTFKVPSELASNPDTVIFITFWNETGWEILPSRIQDTASGPVISAPVSMPGVYSLMTKGEEEEEALPSPTAAGLVATIPLSAALFAFLIISGRKP